MYIYIYMYIYICTNYKRPFSTGIFNGHFQWQSVDMTRGYHIKHRQVANSNGLIGDGDCCPKPAPFLQRKWLKLPRYNRVRLQMNFVGNISEGGYDILLDMIWFTFGYDMIYFWIWYTYIRYPLMYSIGYIKLYMYIYICIYTYT